MLRALTLSALALVAPVALLAGEARVEAGPDGRTWALANGLVERQVAWSDEGGLRTTAFRRVPSGTEFLRSDEDRRHGESTVRVDGESLRVCSGAFELRGAEIVELGRGGVALDVRLGQREGPLELTVRYGVYDRHAVGLADPGYVLPSYASDILLRLGSAYQPPWIYNTWEPFMRAVEEETTRELVAAAAPLGFDIEMRRAGAGD